MKRNTVSRDIISNASLFGVGPSGRLCKFNKNLRAKIWGSLSREILSFIGGSERVIYLIIIYIF